MVKLFINRDRSTVKMGMLPKYDMLIHRFKHAFSYGPRKMIELYKQRVAATKNILVTTAWGPPNDHFDL